MCFTDFQAVEENLCIIINSSLDDIDTEIIAMHYGIVWGERQRVIPQDFPLILWEYSLSFSPYNNHNALR